MRKRRNMTLAAGLVTAALVAWACERSETPAAPDVGAPSFDGMDHGCPVKKFTGGGRIDPRGEKVTFGFNVHVNENCQPIKGQLQVVYHPLQTKWHSTSITSFTSYASPEGGECGEWRGNVRAKHGNGDWHDHNFAVQACDNGEPGRGIDTFWFVSEGEYGTGRTVLTGGNIQVH